MLGGSKHSDIHPVFSCLPPLPAAASAHWRLPTRKQVKDNLLPKQTFEKWEAPFGGIKIITVDEDDGKVNQSQR